jgi:hypothetical protein
MLLVSGGVLVLSSVRFRQIHRLSRDSKKYHLTLFLTVVYAWGAKQSRSRRERRARSVKIKTALESIQGERHGWGCQIHRE